MNIEHETRGMRRLVDLIILLASIGFIASVGILANQYITINRAGLESILWPPTEDWTFRNWRQEPDGTYSAEVYFYKDRPECIFMRDQVISVSFSNPLGVIGESRVRFVGDDTPGNSRPEGWQRVDDRMKFLDAAIVPGTVIRPNVLHQCHDGLPTVSGFQGVVVGQDMPWPEYVQDWIAADRVGSPSDYR